jgi:nucleotide-binding universal stress UspA family protein
MFKKILFATDASPASEHAAQMAVNLARVHGSHLIVVYAIDSYPFIGGGEMNSIGYDSYMESGRNAAHRAFAHVRHLAMIGGTQVPLDTKMIEKSVVYTAILELAEAEHVNLIMVGSHGRSGLGKIFLGSVAAKVVAHSTRPVLVVR